MSKFRFVGVKLHQKEKFKFQKNGKFYYCFPKDCLQLLKSDMTPQGFIEIPLYGWQEKELEKNPENYKLCLKLHKIYRYLTTREQRLFLEMVTKWFIDHPRNKYLIIEFWFKIKKNSGIEYEQK